MKDYIIEEVLSYWETLRNGRMVPKRSELDPRKLRTSLNYTFILEASAPDNIRFRLTGSKLCDCMGMEVRGMPIYSIIRQQERNSFNTTLQTALLKPEILDFQLQPDARMVLLPMSDDEGIINRILGCLSSDPNLPEYPCRFSINSHRKTRIIAAKSTRPHLVSELAENQEPFVQQTKKATENRPPYLRLVK